MITFINIIFTKINKVLSTLCSGWVELSSEAPPPRCLGEVGGAIEGVASCVEGCGHCASHLIKDNVPQLSIDQSPELKHHLKSGTDGTRGRHTECGQCVAVCGIYIYPEVD